MFPIQRNKIVFRSFLGENCSGEPRMIGDLLEKDSYDIVWILDNDADKPEGTRAVRPNSFKEIYELATAKVWVDNTRKSAWAKKRKSQFYIQTWHSPVCIKAVEKDAAGSLPSSYIRGAKQDSRNADIIVSGSEWRTRNILSSFWYDGVIMKAEFRENNKSISETDAEVREYFALSDDDRIVLYVPTFRKDGNLDCYDIDYARLLAVLEATGDKWKVIVRLHPNIARRSESLCFSDQILNGSFYPESHDLVRTADIVITDYSGIMFDAFREKKVVFLYAKDVDSYISKDRNLYFDLRDMPAPLAENNDELERVISQFDKKIYDEKCKHINEVIGYYSVDAALESEKKIREFISAV